MTRETQTIDAEVTVMGRDDVYSPPQPVAATGGAVRDSHGRFAPGNRLGGRNRGDERAIIAAMDRALPPDKLQQSLTDALTWAYEYKSPKMVLAIAQFVVSYKIGTPVQRSVTASGKLENLLDRVAAMDESEFEALESAMRGDG